MTAQEPISSDITEDPEKDGFFNHVVQLTTHTVGLREYRHDQILDVVGVRTV